MARSLRINVADGWYHITNRGIDRHRIFDDDRDYKHLLDLLSAMSERFVVRVIKLANALPDNPVARIIKN